MLYLLFWKETCNGARKWFSLLFTCLGYFRKWKDFSVFPSSVQSANSFIFPVFFYLTLFVWLPHLVKTEFCVGERKIRNQWNFFFSFLFRKMKSVSINRINLSSTSHNAFHAFAWNKAAPRTNCWRVKSTMWPWNGKPRWVKSINHYNNL